MANNIQNREYVLIQTYPTPKKLQIVYRTFDFNQARDKFAIENLANDTRSFGIRICLNGTLYVVQPQTGEIKEESQFQDWKIHHFYQELDDIKDQYGDILICECSYPYFTDLMMESTHSTKPFAGSIPVTCLENDHSREINDCPNCGTNLF